MKLATITAIVIMWSGAAHAGNNTYTYLCRDHQKVHSLKITEAENGGTITWRGKTFHNLKTVESGCKEEWTASDDGVTANVCAATQGVAGLKIGDETFDCQMLLSERQR